MAIVTVHQSWMTIGPDQAEVFSFDPIPEATFLPHPQTAVGFTSHPLHVEASVAWRVEVDGAAGVQVTEAGTKYVPEPGSPEDQLTAFVVALRARYGWTGYRILVEPGSAEPPPAADPGRRSRISDL